MTEKRSPSENLAQETKIYLSKIFSILRIHNGFLSRAGMNLGRSSIGRINELSIDTIRLLVGDDEFLYNSADNDIHEDADLYFWKKKQQLEAGKIKLPQYRLTPWQKKTLTGLGVMLEYGWQVVNEKEKNQFSYADSPVGLGITIVRFMLNPLVDKDEVNREFGKIKDDSEKINHYYQMLYSEVQDLNRKRQHLGP